MTGYEMTEEEFNSCEREEARKHDEKLEELKRQQNKEPESEKVLKFTENGLNFVAGYGFCYAVDEKTGDKVYQALDVFRTIKPTKERVLRLYKVAIKGLTVGMKNEGGISANNTGVSIAAKMTNDEKIQAYIEKLEADNHDLQQKWLSESYEKSKLKERTKKIIRNLLTLSMPIDYAKCPGPLQKIAEAERFLNE